MKRDLFAVFLVMAVLLSSIPGAVFADTEDPANVDTMSAEDSTHTDENKGEVNATEDSENTSMPEKLDEVVSSDSAEIDKDKVNELVDNEEKNTNSNETTLPEDGDTNEVLASGKCGTDVKWSLTSDGVLTLSGSGAIYDYSYDNKDVPWAGYVYVIKTLDIGEGITRVGDYAFKDFSAIVTLDLPNSLTSIGTGSFQNCTSLSGDLVFPDSVTEIGEHAFDNCSGFRGRLVLPKSIKIIRSCSFYQCSGFTGELIIPDSVTEVESHAFAFCDSFSGRLVLSKKLKTVGNSAFRFYTSGGTNIPLLVIPASVQSIGSEAFYTSSNRSVVYFEGNAPFASTNPFYTKQLIIYKKSCSGWADPWGGCKTVGISPGEELLIQATDSKCGVYIPATDEDHISDSIEVLPPLGKVELLSNKFAYSGNEIKPEVKVTDYYGKELDRNDYSLSYENNIYVSTLTNKAKIIVKGKNRYSFTKTLEFNIDKGKLPSSAFHVEDKVYDGMGGNFSLIVDSNLKEGVDYVVLRYEKTVYDYSTQSWKHSTVTKNEVKDAASYSVYISGKNNYSSDKRDLVVKSFNIKTKNINDSGIRLAEDTFTYSWKPLNKLSVTSTDNMIEDVDYSILYFNPEWTPGNYSVTICGKNNYVGSKSFPISILPHPDGWAYEDNEWHYYMSGVKIGEGWFTDSDGTIYCFNENGAMRTGWLKSGESWYYFKANGAMATGWVKVGSAWYYMDTAGVMQTGWLNNGGKWYYLTSSGAMATGWAKVGSAWYYMNTSGAMQTGWLNSGGKWYYLNSSGAMATGWVKVGSAWYYMNSSGAMQTGWLKISGKWYYFDGSGKMVTGTVKIGGKKYRFSSNGVWTGR